MRIHPNGTEELLLAKKYKLMNRMTVSFFLVAIGLILFIMCLSVWGTKEINLLGGILLIYSGILALLYSRKEEKNDLSGIRFRGILTGISCIITGLVAAISYFFQ